MSAFIKASAYALTQQPTVNAVIDGHEIVYRVYVDISVAVATPKVPFYFLYHDILSNVNCS
jgi:2-oxoglutarate dehydrogenase E2 component (dihydrolipoamide succinyltransferase)